MNEQQMGQGFGEQPLVDNHSVRNKPLDPEFIDNYLEKNRHRVGFKIQVQMIFDFCRSIPAQNAKSTFRNVVTFNVIWPIIRTWTYALLAAITVRNVSPLRSN